MKGIVLAGGSGSRLWPLTACSNKHMLPVWKYPMIMYPLGTLVEAGIDDIMIVTGGNNAGDFLALLGDGASFGLTQLAFGYQRGAGGIADALRVAKNFVGNDKMVVVLGDNILAGSIEPQVTKFVDRERGAQIFTYPVDNPREYGVARFNARGEVVEIIEKPEEPPSNRAVIGVYMYDLSVWSVIEELKPSGRGELEITDVNSWYVEQGIMFASDFDGQWADAGSSHDSLWEATVMARKANLLSEFGLGREE